ncbi:MULTISPECIES: hypothetical protein [Cyanophyceae]|uniref:hypothetical protein n=1 Tax=Cyanophyceae TaxID=3028117 RepID=UPI001684EE6C|nr:hypothetical protein [Trichocoleus sp. FACHB-40]MBD2005112.1 hypothetical protein [Trichocoleus sp. FACHB-40]
MIEGNLGDFEVKISAIAFAELRIVQHVYPIQLLAWRLLGIGISGQCSWLVFLQSFMQESLEKV